MKQNGAMKEDGAARLLLLRALSEMCERCMPGAAVILICILSSLLSIRRVIVLEPAVVFRG